MSSNTKQPNTKPQQIEIMVDFMKDHDDLAKGHLKTSNAKQTSIHLWGRLTEELNSIGPPAHTIVEWKKIWADYKTYIKAKLRKNKMGISGTGGGPSKFCALTPLEQQVVDLLNMKETIEGTSGIARFGDSPIDAADNSTSLNIENNSIDVMQTVPHPLRIIETNTTTSTPIRPKSLPKGTEGLLKLQVENQILHHKKSEEKLAEISESLKNISRYARKNYELNEKKFEFKKKNELEKRKLKAEKLDIKRQMLDLERQKYGL